MPYAYINAGKQLGNGTTDEIVSQSVRMQGDKVVLKKRFIVTKEAKKNVCAIACSWL